MTRRWALALSAVAAVSLAACESDSATSVGPRGQEAFTRYVAMGTSLSQGVSNGDNAVVYFNQVNSWPALLARQAGNTNFTQPLMRSPGCFPPIIAPLALGRNLRGASIATTDTTCAGPLPGFPNPANAPYNNTAISGALTAYALNYTPEITAQQGIGGGANGAGNSSAVFRRKMYPLVLPAGKTQVTAMLAQNPTFVSVEFGANEVLGGPTSGLVVPGTTYVPAAVWQPDYDKIIDSVVSTGAKAMLVTVPNVANIIAMRTGAELFADSANFKNRFRVTVLQDCKDSPNLVFTARLVPGTIAFAAANPAVPVVPLSCTNGTTANPDYILTPADVATLSAEIDAMNAHIAEVASTHGWALLDANAVLGEIKTARPVYSVVRQMTCTMPYGPYIGLDGVHPTPVGYTKVANAAIEAVNAQYDFTIQRIAESVPDYATICP